MRSDLSRLHRSPVTLGVGVNLQQCHGPLE